jgi:hypothetical protein
LYNGYFGASIPDWKMAIEEPRYLTVIMATWERPYLTDDYIGACIPYWYNG